MQRPLVDRYARICGKRHATLVMRAARVSQASAILLLAGGIGAFLPWGDARVPLGMLWFILLATCLAFAWHLARAKADVAARLVKCRDEALRRDLAWSGLPCARSPSAAVALRQPHAYAHDIMIAGEQSLHHLLDRAATVGGSDMLYQWLTDGATSADGYAERRSLVAALESRPGLRMALRLIPLDDRVDLRLAEDGRETRFPGPLVFFAYGTAWLTIVAFALSGAVNTLLFLLLTYVAVFTFRTDMSALWEPPPPRRQIHQLMTVLRFARRHVGRAPEPVSALLRVFTDERHGIAAFEKRLRLAALLDGIEHSLIFLFLLNALLPATALVSWSRMRVKALAAREGREWVEAWSRIEAAASLAWLADQPAYVEPVVQSRFGVMLQDFGHPLMPTAGEVRNSVLFDETSRFICLTGANMSGKSTALRSIALNVVLLCAGAKLKATSAVACLVALHSSIRSEDSLEQKRSRFAAEVDQIGLLITSVATDVPSLFLIDEIFSSTNGQEREEATDLLADRLMASNAMGIVTTHDAAVIDMLSGKPGVRFAHTASRIEGDELVFSYRMEPGKVIDRNAIAILRARGILNAVDPPPADSAWPI